MDERKRRYFDARLRALRSRERGVLPGMPDVAREALSSARLKQERIVGKALDRAEEAVRSEAGKALRPDAALILYLDFLELVALPLADRDTVGQGDLTEVLFADIQQVALRAASESDEKEISSHSIVTAVSDAWPELQLAKMQYW